jgi:hypothetical protein
MFIFFIPSGGTCQELPNQASPEPLSLEQKHNSVRGPQNITGMPRMPLDIEPYGSEAGTSASLPHHEAAEVKTWDGAAKGEYPFHALPPESNQ